MLVCNHAHACNTPSKTWQCMALSPARLPLSTAALPPAQIYSMSVKKRPRRTRSAPPAIRRATGTLHHAEDSTSPPDKLHVVWQVEQHMQWQCWMDFAAPHQQLLERAWDADASIVVLAPSPAEGRRDAWSVSFATMQQRNERTGTLRRVRRMLVSHA